MSKSQPLSAGVGFADLLTLILITLKFCGVINWPWWMVLLPLLLSGLASLLLLALSGVFLWLASNSEKD